MLTDPEEGHYSAENKAGEAFTLDWIVPERLFKLVHTHRGWRSQRQPWDPGLWLQTWKPRSLTAAQCWAHTGTEESWGGGLWWRWMFGNKDDLASLCWTQLGRRHVTVLWGVAQEQLTSIALVWDWRFNRVKEMQWGLGHYVEHATKYESAGWFNNTHSALVHLNWIHWQ